jgi:hypothetical protein
MTNSGGTGIRLTDTCVYIATDALPEGALFSAFADARGIEHLGDRWLVPWHAVLDGAAWANDDTPQDTELAESGGDESHASVEADLDLLAWLSSLIRLPPESSLTLSVRCKGSFSHPDRFACAASWETDGMPIATTGALGPMLRDAEGNFHRRMTRAQWRVSELIRKFAGVTDEDELRRLVARIKQAADKSVRLDRYLTNEDLVELEAVAPVLVPLPDGSGYTIEPDGHGISRPDLKRYVSERGRGSIRLSNGGAGRRTVVLSERATRGVEAIRKRSTVLREDMPKMLSDPQEFFGPDLDTSAFTERVVGVGVVTTDQQAFGSALEIGGWFEFTPDENASYVRDPLDLQTPEKRDMVCAAIREAEKDGLAWIKNPLGEGYLQITAALKAAVCATPEAPKIERRGLLVKSNENELEVESKQELEYVESLTTIPSLPLRSGVRLAPHQELGVRWLMTLAGARDQGALLADDMGLGKTLQVLSFLAGLRTAGRVGPHLVVAPIGLLRNWECEAERFFGDLFQDVVVVQGRIRLTHTTLESKALVLVGYDSLRMNELVFARVRWDVVVLDEAQRIKNSKTQVARVVRALHARFRLAATGTPVENSLDELWSIFDWVMPGLLGTRQTFREDFVEPARAGAQRGTWTELAELSVVLRARLGRYFLRRTKDEVLSLKPLTVQSNRVPMSCEQRARYSEILGQKKKGLPALTALQRLFDVCSHPALGAMNNARLPTGVTYPKAQSLWQILDDVRLAGEKAIVFAKRIPIQAWIADEIAERYGRRPAVINGVVSSSAERISIVDRFQAAEGFRVLVLGPRAAGVGLNITAANHVIHFTREWNPAVENQATDRAYRMGQMRPVTVHRLIVSGDSDGRTVEERLDDLLERKRGLMREFVVPLVPFEVEANDFAL